jgi:hypothetical protein
MSRSVPELKAQGTTAIVSPALTKRSNRAHITRVDAGIDVAHQNGALGRARHWLRDQPGRSAEVGTQRVNDTAVVDIFSQERVEVILDGQNVNPEAQAAIRVGEDVVRSSSGEDGVRS